jgi:predicted deacetylase
MKPALAQPGTDGALCLVLHDVAPARWRACRRVLDAVAAAAAASGQGLPPMTLLVVPQWHGDERAPEEYLRWLRGMARAGHQLALHGCTHRDDEPVKGLRQVLLRRCFTAGEGEFAALSRAQAQARLQQGRAWAAQHDLPLAGFVAPAWLLSDGAWDALRDSGLDHTAGPGWVMALPQGARVRAPSLMYSSRSAPRRALSLAWNRALAWRQRHAPVLRLDLHPDDADHALLRRQWSRWLRASLRTRRALRLDEMARRLACGT